MYHKFVEMNRAVNVRPSGSSRAETLRRQRGDEDYDQASQQKIVNWEAVRQDLWDNTCRIQQWLKHCGEWRCGTTLTLRRGGAEVEWMFLLRLFGAPFLLQRLR